MSVLPQKAIFSMLLVTYFLIGALHRTASISSLVNNSFEHWLNFPLSTTTMHEYDPPWFSRNEAFELSSSFDGQAAVIVEGNGELSVESVNGTKKEFQVSVENNSIVLLPTMYYPGWKAFVDGNVYDLKANKEAYAGLIHIEVPEGKHSLLVKFTQGTALRYFANWLSILAFATVCLLLLRESSLLKKFVK